MKNTIIIILLAISVVLVFCMNGACADNKLDEAKAAKVTESEKMPTKQEMIDNIKDTLKYNPNMAAVVAGLQAKEEGGVATYTYQGKKLDELDEETLSKILGTMRRQISLENINKMNVQQRQLRSMRQMEDLNKQLRALRQVTPHMSEPPKAYTPPKVYTPPKTNKTKY